MPKAARIGDSCAGHGCFPATPITAGSGDVSINGIPAARKGDSVLFHACPCPKVPHGIHGRSISAGSANVSINGKEAARYGDAVGCGGSVAAGSGDVLIGDTPYQSTEHPCGEAAAKDNAPFIKLLPLAALPVMQWADAGEMVSFLNDPVNSVAERKARYEARKALSQSHAGSASAAKKAASERLAFNNDNILRAEAAQYVYRVDEFKRGHISELPEPPLGLEAVDTSKIPGLNNAVFSDKETGFGAGLFKSAINDETMLTFRGTNNGVTGGKDWPTNLKQGSGGETKQYNQAMYLADMVDDSLDDFTIVGHSLGGGLAASAVGVTGRNGYTFNAAGLHPKTMERRGGLPIAEIDKLIQTQAVNGEVLTGVQKWRGVLLPGLLGGIGSLFGPVGTGLGLLASGILMARDTLPSAPGEMHKLESIAGGNPVARHGMDQVIAGIEAQKREDITTLTQAA
ncbi:PAAR domain-containing protein [Shewanella algae]|uniref:PAAR domain-containing protein n=1 Tax=Shewanella algae TaxID=38313 RepID=UPI00313E27D6